MLQEVRLPLLEEAQRSPHLLSDLAGLEKYVAESYDSRSFIELLQNADDAKATSFLVKKIHGYLIVANNGNPFTVSDFESICRSASSTKSRGSSIGYRGIGFKSVVGLAEVVHIISDGLETTFSRDLTARAVPQASRVPLIRIPHELDSATRQAIIPEVEVLRKQGYVTFFVFGDFTASAIDNEFLSFDATSLLFLRNIQKLSLVAGAVESYVVGREEWGGAVRLVQISSEREVSNWIVVGNQEGSVAFYQDSVSEVIERLPESDAVVHAFLPTNESTGLGVKLNSDISTDPSRTRIVFDDRTDQGVSDLAAILAGLVNDIVLDKPMPDSIGMLKALLPLDDPRMHKYQKRSFKSELFRRLQEVCKLDRFVLRPLWLNSIDFELLAKLSGLEPMPQSVEGVDGASALMRYLGAKDVGVNDMSRSFVSQNISQGGCSEIVSELVRLADTKQINVSDIDVSWPIWVSGNKKLSIAQIDESELVLDEAFIDMVVEKTAGAGGVSRLVSALTNLSAASKIIPTVRKETASLDSVLQKNSEWSVDSVFDQVTSLSLKKWRGAEEQVKHIFMAQGWIANDVSRQNLGYDIECVDKDGKKIFVEVKLIASPSQPFTLTSNEEAVARQKGDSYYLAIVQQLGDFLDVCFIPNPVDKLELVRSCRQWVWECSQYPFAPVRFELC
ncbi:hypothetical protein ABH909_002721 [Pseudomonas sp. BS3782 TE3695]|jgi:hypothetical protein|uniref:DUF3883 domain-containing protein n=1 Tax=Pseudomonas sp. BS3782 TE3695 TaxID=3349323 RepID=UPI003D1A7F6B